jgi:hypothetical protein
MGILRVHMFPAFVFLASVQGHLQMIDVFHVLSLSGVEIPVAMSVLEVPGW